MRNLKWMAAKTKGEQKNGIDLALTTIENVMVLIFVA